MGEVKVCIKCHISKSLSEFPIRSDSKKYRNECKDCTKRYKASYHLDNKSLHNERARIYHSSNKQRINAHRQLNKDKINKQKREYYRRNKSKILSNQKKWIREKAKADPIFAWRMYVRKLTCAAFHRTGKKKNNKTEALIGCSIEFLRSYIESLFKEGMSWENRREWHVDHIIPISSASSIEELSRLCHYTNLQPLWAKDNLSKGPKIKTDI